MPIDLSGLPPLPADFSFNPPVGGNNVPDSNNNFMNSWYAAQNNNSTPQDMPSDDNPSNNTTGSAAPSTGGSSAKGSLSGNLIGGAIGAYEFFKAQSALNQLNNTPLPSYTVGAPLQNAYSTALSMNNQGFTPGEKTAYQSNLNRGIATKYNQALQLGGSNLANTISGVLGADEVSGQDKMSIADAALHRQNLDRTAGLAGQLQQIQDMNTAAQWKYRLYQEQAWGGAQTAGLQSIANSFNGGVSLTNIAL